MRINEKEVQRVAEAVVRALLSKGFVHLKVGEKQLVDRITRLLLDNLRAEEALERDAEKLAEKLARQTAGMDLQKVIHGIKVRLAKERGFTL